MNTQESYTSDVRRRVNALLVQVGVDLQATCRKLAVAAAEAESLGEPHAAAMADTARQTIQQFAETFQAAFRVRALPPIVKPVEYKVQPETPPLTHPKPVAVASLSLADIMKALAK